MRGDRPQATGRHCVSNSVALLPGHRHDSHGRLLREAASFCPVAFPAGWWSPASNWPVGSSDRHCTNGRVIQKRACVSVQWEKDRRTQVFLVGFYCLWVSAVCRFHWFYYLMYESLLFSSADRYTFAQLVWLWLHPLVVPLLQQPCSHFPQRRATQPSLW